jgi:GTPase Era involved in 16S rRNA processing
MSSKPKEKTMISVQEMDWARCLSQLYAQLEETDDQETAEKIIDLLYKYKERTFSLVFCGHFSAGKSTLLNRLFNKRLLPTSPIPTSANVVKIRKGDGEIRLRFLDREEEVYHGTYTEEQFRAMCKQGGEVAEIELVLEDAPFPEGVVLVDTPGIDSTDPAHRKITQQALHLADEIFYTVDYNYVQAAGNFQFIKELVERGKRVTLIVNQVDKHREAEIAFSEYRASILASLANWGIEMERVFFLSLKERSHPHNQWSQLLQYVHSLLEHREERQVETIKKEATWLVQQHVKQLQEDGGEDKGTVDVQSLEKQRASLDQEIHQLNNEEVEKERQALVDNMESLFQHAYLMPASLRDTAYAYLESLQPGFKVGFLFSRAKTEKEQQRRAEQFYSALQEVITAQIETHLVSLLEGFASEHGLWNDELSKDLRSKLPTMPQSLLKEVYHQGAILSGRYLLTYSETLSQQIQAIYREYGLAFVDRFYALQKEEAESKKKKLQQQRETIERRLKEADQAQKSQDDLEAYKRKLQAILKGEGDSPITGEELMQRRSQRVVEQLSLPQEKEKKVDSVQETVPVTEHKVPSPEQMVSYLQKVETILRRYSQLSGFMADLKAKRERLEKQQFTVVLFGAFSAGKSSFINALLGDRVIPVSPHPTTAALTRICPPDRQNAHGFGKITYLSETALLQELQRVFRLFQEEIGSLDEAVGQTDQLLKQKALSPSQKLAIPFLKAVKENFATIRPHLGTQIRCTQTELSAIVGTEKKACFIESAELYYDSPLAPYGITLVDTPGADSIHSRHTHTAFQYFKEADAILYLNYYNHAFSQGDRERLMQLGRVQDLFTVDKLFFILNAADLAATEEELLAVSGYIKQQLQSYGIRRPRLFPVSSLRAMDPQQRAESGLPQFEEAFYPFIQTDLQAAVVQAARKEVQRIERWVDEWVATSQLNHEQKEQQRDEWREDRKQIEKQIFDLATVADREALKQEQKELIYHLKERLRLRFQDLFGEFVNPASISENGRAGKKQLSTALYEFALFLQQVVEQELRSLALRLEVWIERRLGYLQECLQELWQEKHPLFLLQAIEDLSFPEMVWGELTPFQADQEVVALFKNKKAFFEQGGRKALQERLEVVVQAWVNDFLKDEEKRLTDHFAAVWSKQVDRWKRDCQEQLERYFQERLAALSETEEGRAQKAQQELAEIKERLLREDL